MRRIRRVTGWAGTVLDYTGPCAFGLRLWLACLLPERAEVEPEVVT